MIYLCFSCFLTILTEKTENIYTPYMRNSTITVIPVLHEIQRSFWFDLWCQFWCHLMRNHAQRYATVLPKSVIMQRFLQPHATMCNHRSVTPTPKATGSNPAGRTIPLEPLRFTGAFLFGSSFRCCHCGAFSGKIRIYVLHEARRVYPC